PARARRRPGAHRARRRAGRAAAPTRRAARRGAAARAPRARLERCVRQAARQARRTVTSTPPVFLAGPGLLDGYGAGDRYVLEGAEARHAGVVQRRRPGERVDVADGAGVRLECVVEGVAPGRLELAVLDR